MVSRNGKQGIILASDAWQFIPDGCTQLFDVDSNELTKVTELTDNKVVTGGEIDELYETAAASMIRKRKGSLKAFARASKDSFARAFDSLANHPFITRFFLLEIASATAILELSNSE